MRRYALLLLASSAASSAAADPFDFALTLQPAQTGPEVFLRVTSILVQGCGSPLFPPEVVGADASTLRVRVFTTDYVDCRLAETSRTFPLGALPPGVTQVAVYVCADFAPPGADPCLPQPARVFDLTQQGAVASIPTMSRAGAGWLLAGMFGALLWLRRRVRSSRA